MEWRRTVLAEEPLGQTLGLGTATSVFLERNRCPFTFNKPDKGTQCISIWVYICMQSMFCTYARMHVCMQVLCIYECMNVCIYEVCAGAQSHRAWHWNQNWRVAQQWKDKTTHICAVPAASNRVNGVAHNCVGLLTASCIHVEGLPEQGKKQTLFACDEYLRPSIHDAVLGCRLSQGRTSILDMARLPHRRYECVKRNCLY